MNDHIKFFSTQSSVTFGGAKKVACIDCQQFAAHDAICDLFNQSRKG
jgi:hypothetical protein